MTIRLYDGATIWVFLKFCCLLFQQLRFCDCTAWGSIYVRDGKFSCILRWYDYFHFALLYQIIFCYIATILTYDDAI